MFNNRVASILFVVVGFFVAWEVLVLVLQPPSYFVPRFSVVLSELASNPLWYLNHSLQTLYTTMLGFGLALLLGVLAAVGIVYSKFLENTLYTLLVSLNSIPKIALAPLFIIWMGTGTASKVAVAFLIALFAIVIDAVLGLKSVNPDALDLFRTMKARPLQVLFKVRFPNALPHIFAGMKVAISLALVGAIAGEFVASQEGLGYVILSAQGMFQTDRVFASILLLGLMGT
uniref:ABC transporter permease n=1 Tax=Roseovarius sp. TaxID=1486281 RepID=UPI003564E2D6